MFVTITICLLSTVAFCLSARGLIVILAKTPQGSTFSLIGRQGFNARARRIARGYATFALSVLMLMFFASAISAYADLFTFHLSQ